MSTLKQIRENNCIQPNRFFSFHGDVKFIEKETEYTKIILSVLSYDSFRNDDIMVYFKGNVKRTADVSIIPKCHLSVMGDVVIKDDIIFFNGKVFEVFKSAQHLVTENSKVVDPKDINYDGAY